MFDFLVTSKARKRLVRLLFVEHASGSVSELAARARVGFASAHRELHAMRAAGLAGSKRIGRVERFAANEAHPLAAALCALAAAPARHPAEADDHTRNALFTLGAPTFGEEIPVEDREYALVRGVALSHRDGTVATVLPIVLYRQRDRWSAERLVRHARALGEKRALGFFLELTSELSGDPRFARWARPLRDRRCSSVKYLFDDDTRSPLARQIAERNTPPVARRWNLRANTGLDAFRATFEKHANA